MSTLPTREPGEPTGPADATEDRSRLWLAAWGLLAAAGLGVAVFALIDGDHTELLALALAATALAVAVALHHLIVTRDAGELRDVRRVDDRLVEDRIGDALGRRPVLVRGVVGLTALGGVVAVGGLRWLGPRRDAGTPWGPGVAAVTTEGERLRPEDVAEGGVVTVWPEGAIGDETSAVMVIRLRDEPVAPTDAGGVVDDRVVGYSRICTHAGCPVALYRDLDQALFCPCHQATFDARAGAQPTFGPASGPLPQLLLGLDDDGLLIALDDFSTRPGPRGGEV